jgi:hypothetical protein
LARYLFPRTVQEFLAELDRRFPEPRPTEKTSAEDLRWQSAQRQVYLIMRDAHEAATRKDPDVLG